MLAAPFPTDLLSLRRKEQKRAMLLPSETFVQRTGEQIRAISRN